MYEEEFNDLYNSVANSNNDEFIDYESDELDDYRDYIISRCAELAQEEGFGD